MKLFLRNSIILLLLVGLFQSVNAQTYITTPTVSGIWTQSASPYYIQNDVTVPANSSLIIQAGVQVVFSAATKMSVIGTLQGNGTSSSPVIFKANDTIGWSNELISNGGWRGVFLDLFQGSFTDSSRFTYCKFQDFKPCTPTYLYNTYAFTSFNRNLKLSHCDFFHNRSKDTAVALGILIMLETSTGQTLTIEDCNFYDNYSWLDMMRIGNSQGGNTIVRNNHFYNNKGGTVLNTIYGNMIFEKNEMNNNVNDNSFFGILELYGRSNLIRNNKIHHNSTYKVAAISSTWGHTTFDANLICNNITTSSTFCGAAHGGGGMRLVHNAGIPKDSTQYIVKNNIIANNEAAFQGGGIQIFDCHADILNNTIVHNRSQNQGGGIYFLGLNILVNIKNNIFWGNKNQDTLPSSLLMNTHDVIGHSGISFSFDNNWIEKPFSAAMFNIGAVPRVGDTIHNVIGITPNLISPTTSFSYLDNALAKNFDLNLLSTCIDAGDTTGASMSLLDYGYNNRFVGNKIDIGAYESPLKGSESTNDILDRIKLLMYPNPSNGYVSFDFSSDELGAIDIQIFDLVGNKLFALNNIKSNEEINLNSLSTGIYICHVRTLKGRSSQRLILTH